MRTRARSKAAGTFLALAASILLVAPQAARAAGDQDLDLAPPAASQAPDMCPARSAREAESQIFGLRQQLMAQLPAEPDDPSFKVLNTQGANYASGQRLPDPAVLHVEGALPH